MANKRTDYRPCPFCGANLDPGEICECRKTQMTNNIAGNHSDPGCVFCGREVPEGRQVCPRCEVDLANG